MVVEKVRRGCVVVGMIIGMAPALAVMEGVGIVFQFVMVFIGNPRSGTNRGGGVRIILRSKPSWLRLRHTCNPTTTRGRRWWQIVVVRGMVRMVVGVVWRWWYGC